MKRNNRDIRKSRLLKKLQDWYFAQHKLSHEDVEEIKIVINESFDRGYEQGKLEQSLFAGRSVHTSTVEEVRNEH